jgi:hypothetical protein
MKKEGKRKSGLGMAPEARLFEQTQKGCGNSLDLLMARHEGLVCYAVNRQNLGDLPDEEAEPRLEPGGDAAKIGQTTLC